MRLTRSLRTSSRLVGVAAGSLLLIGSLISSGTDAHTVSPARVPMSRGLGTGQITTLDMTSPSSGWGWGPTLVAQTVDGAARLVDVTPRGVSRANPVMAETALNATRAWIVAGPSSASGRFTVYRTRDGGQTWSSATIGNHQAGDITFVDSRHGWMQASRLVDRHRVNEITLSRTVDGGARWSTIYRTRQRISIEPNIQTGDCQWSLARFSTPLHGIVSLGCEGTGTLGIERTEDGGKTWHRATLPPFHHPPGAVLWSGVQRPFLAGSAGAAFVTLCVGSTSSCSAYGRVYQSTDGGKTWSARRAVVRGGVDAAFADPAHVWLPDGCLKACPAEALLLRTRDGGTRWTSAALPPALAPNMHGSRQFQFVSPLVGFAVTSQEFAPRPHFFRTTDGGKSFHMFQPRIVHP